MRHYGVDALMQQFGGLSTIYQNFFIGLRPGCIGETSAVLILLGGLFLMARGIITWHIPVSTIATVAVLSWIFGGETWFTGQPLVHVLSGGLMLGAFYMCTDYVTSPTLKSGQIVFGIGVGAPDRAHSSQGRISGRGVLRHPADELPHSGSGRVVQTEEICTSQSRRR